MAAVYSQRINTVVIIKHSKNQKNLERTFCRWKSNLLIIEITTINKLPFTNLFVYLYWNNTQLVFFVEISKPFVLFNSKVMEQIFSNMII